MADLKKFTGSAQITDEGIKKHFKNYEPVDVLFELVWNGLDANADVIDIKINLNGLDGIESITVLDNGEGINLDALENSFGKFNESTKKFNDDKHGSHGRGRLAFYQLCSFATWYTRFSGRDAKIWIKGDSIKTYEGINIDKKDQIRGLNRCESGTCVELKNFSDNKIKQDVDFSKKFSKEFGWFLALNSNVKIKINGHPVTVPSNEKFSKKFKIDGNDFRLELFRWDDKPSSEKSYNYLISSKSRVIRKELSSFNNKVTFHTSAYIFSDWIDSYNPEELELSSDRSTNEEVVKSVMKEVRNFQTEVYKNYLRKFVNEEISKYEENGFFPEYQGIDPNYAEFRKNNTKSLIKEIYIADPTIFNKLKGKQAKILIRLLDTLLVSNENDSLFDVLDGVLDLSADGMDALAQQLSKTTFDHIISTIETLQKREIAVYKLREIIGVRYNEVLETPDLQKIIEHNTWLFGARYTTMGAEEDNFTKISRNLRDQIKEINVVEQADVFDEIGINGAQKQVDLFLARKIPAFDHNGQEIYKCTIIEIKRPSISLNKKHLAQLDEYAEIISKHPEFSSDKLRFELILVGRKISKDDFQIRQRMTNLKDKAEFGLVTDNTKMKCYVKDWFTIFDEFSLANHYLLEKLNSKLEDISGFDTIDMVSSLQSGQIKKIEFKGDTIKEQKLSLSS